MVPESPGVAGPAGANSGVEVSLSVASANPDAREADGNGATRLRDSSPAPLPAGPTHGADTVTAIVVAKNEEKWLEGCLRSVLWADRILVIDNESSDQTAEIARRYTEWVISRGGVPPGTDPNHDNLNYGFTLIPEGWLIHLDADERASPRLGREIRSKIAGTPHSAFSVPFRIGILGRWPRYGYWGATSKLIRVFRAGRARYPLRAIHERPDIVGTVGELEGVIYHLPYPTIAEFVSKTNRWTSLDAGRILSGESPGASSFGRKAAHPSGLRLLWSGARLFLWSFLRLGGWREGRIGVATSAMLGMYGLIEVLKVWEKADGLDREIKIPEDDHD